MYGCIRARESSCIRGAAWCPAGLLEFMLCRQTLWSRLWGRRTRRAERTQNVDRPIRRASALGFMGRIGRTPSTGELLVARPREARQTDTDTQISGQTQTDDDTDGRHKQIQLDTDRQMQTDGQTDSGRQTDRWAPSWPDSFILYYLLSAWT